MDGWVGGSSTRGSLEYVVVHNIWAHTHRCASASAPLAVAITPMMTKNTILVVAFAEAESASCSSSWLGNSKCMVARPEDSKKARGAVAVGEFCKRVVLQPATEKTRRHRGRIAAPCVCWVGVGLGPGEGVEQRMGRSWASRRGCCHRIHCGLNLESSERSSYPLFVGL